MSLHETAQQMNTARQEVLTAAGLARGEAAAVDGLLSKDLIRLGDTVRTMAHLAFTLSRELPEEGPRTIEEHLERAQAGYSDALDGVDSAGGFAGGIGAAREAIDRAACHTVAIQNELAGLHNTLNGAVDQIMQLWPVLFAAKGGYVDAAVAAEAVAGLDDEYRTERDMPPAPRSV